MLKIPSFLNFRSRPVNGQDGEELPSLKERLIALRNIPRMFKLIWKTSPPMTLANLGLRLIQAATPLAMLYLGKLIIDEIVRLVGSGGNDLSYLWKLVAAELSIAILSDLVGRGISLLDSLLGDLFTNRTSVQLMDKAALMDLENFEDSTFYDKLGRARRQTTGRMVLMSQALGQVQDIITITFLAGGLIAFNPWLIVLLVVTVIPAFLGEAHFNTRSYSLMRRWTPERRQLDYLRYTGASDLTAKEVKIFGLSAYLTRLYEQLANDFYRANRALAVKRASWGGFLAAVASMGYYSAYALIAWRTASGHLSLGDLTFLAGSFSRMRSLLQGILTRFSSLAEGALYLNDLFEFFELQPQIVSPPHPRPFPAPIRRGFVFEGVGFRYPGSQEWALRHISFELKAGEKLALVGENGAGKTTLVKLLARLYDPGEGRILLDGFDLREYDVQDVRREIGIIFQDYVRYHFTAGDNIAIGRIEARENRSQVENAAKQGLADSVIEKLPGRYEQILGKRFDTGVELSGGEWQKIALARAYMRDAQILILDEPTASLDARAERQVYERFTDLTRGKTAVLISHRFSTVRMADRILVLENGGILEIGAHAELLEMNGRYAELFNLQAEGYR